MKILITGANSFIGKSYQQHSHFDKIEEVCLIKNKPTDIDLKNIDVVFHLAAIVHKKNSPDNLYYEVNKDLAISMAKEAKQRGVKHFIFMSTLSVYGDYQGSPFNEFSACKPVNAYGKSKLEAEKELKKLSDSNFCVSIFRTPLVYGEGVKANMLSLLKLINKFPILPLRGITNKRSFTAIENLCRYVDLIIEKKIEGVFIATDLQPLSTTELVKKIAKHLNKRIVLIKVPKLFLKLARKIKPNLTDRLYGSFIVDNAYTVKKLNYKEVISTEEAVEKMVKFYINTNR